MNFRGSSTAQFEDNGFVHFRGGSGFSFEVGNGTNLNTGVVGIPGPQDSWMYVKYVKSYDTDPFTTGITLSAPSNLQVTNCSSPPSGNIDLAWDSYVDQATNVELEIFRSVDNINFSEIAQIASSSTSYQDTTVQPGTTYYYRIKATTTDSSANDSTFSNTVQCQTEFSAPSGNCSLQYFDPNTSQWVTPSTGIVEFTVPDTETEIQFRSICDNCTGGNSTESLATLTNTTTAVDSTFAGTTGTTLNIDPRSNNTDAQGDTPQQLTHINGTGVSVGVGFNVSLGGETVTFTLLGDGTVDVDTTGDITNETVVFRYQDSGVTLPAASDNETVTLSFSSGAAIFDWTTADGGFYAGDQSGWVESGGSPGELQQITGLDGQVYVPDTTVLYVDGSGVLSGNGSVNAEIDFNNGGNPTSEHSGAYTHFMVLTYEGNSDRHCKFQSNGGANTWDVQSDGIEIRMSGFTTEKLSGTFTSGVTYFIVVRRNASGFVEAWQGTSGADLTYLGITANGSTINVGEINEVTMGNNESMEHFTYHTSELTNTQVENAYDQAKLDYVLG